MRTVRRVSGYVSSACCSHAMLLCVLSLCALPQNVHAQQPNSVSIPGGLPIIGHVYQTQPVAGVPVFSDLPIVGRLYRIEPKTPVQPKTPGRQTDNLPLVNIEAKSAMLGTVIELLMDQAHFSYMLDAELEKVPIGSLKLRKVPFDIALRAILKSASGRATYTREDGIYHIIPCEKQEAEPRRAMQPPGESSVKANVETVTPASTDMDRKFTLEFEDTPLMTALRLLFSQTNLKYIVALDPALRNYRINAHIKNVDARSALEQLLKSADGGLTYRVENGVYQIIPRPKENTENGKP